MFRLGAERDALGLPILPPDLGEWVACTDEEVDDIYHAHGGTEGSLSGGCWDETLRVLVLERGPLGEPVDLPLLAAVDPKGPAPACYRLEPSPATVAKMLCAHPAPFVDCLEQAVCYARGHFYCAEHEYARWEPR